MNESPDSKSRVALHAQPEPAVVPTIACTAHNKWEWRSKAILAGCTDFITKPIDSEGLLAMLSRYLRDSYSAQQ